MHLPNHLVCLLALATTLAMSLRAADDYKPGPDSLPQPGVPKGELVKGTFDQSKVFPGTVRDYTVYLPTQLDRAKPAPVMVLQDGGGFSAPTVFDNLIHKKEIPVLVGVFVQHGRVKAPSTNALDRFNRSYEYDGLSGDYAKFLLDELLPFIEAKHGVKLSKNGTDRAIGGASSGAIAAFTAAWERSEAFTRVFSAIGTYVGLRGGNVYPTILRKYEPKAIRVYLQDGSADQNIYGGDWWMANLEMERALKFAGYEVEHAWGDGGHNGKHATAIFPDALRWLWKDWPALPKAGLGSPQLKDILLPGADWELVAEGYKFTEGPTANAAGEVFYNEGPSSTTYKVGPDGKPVVFLADSKKGDGQRFGPDGRLYSVAAATQQILAWDAAGKSTVVADGFKGNDLVVAHNGNLYVTEPNWTGANTNTRGSGSSGPTAPSKSWTPASSSRTASRSRRTRRCSTSRTAARTGFTAIKSRRTARSSTSSVTSTSTCPTPPTTAGRMASAPTATGACGSPPASACKFATKPAA